MEPTVDKAATSANAPHVVTNYEAAFTRFEQIDKNGDGKISVEELVSLGMTEEQARQEIEAHDTDGDGSVSWSEYLEKKKQDSLGTTASKDDVPARQDASHAEKHIDMAGAARVHDDLSYKAAALEHTAEKDTQ